MPLATYVLRGQLLATASLPVGAASVAFFCFTCGTRWADIRVEGARWRVECVSCEQCPPHWLDGSRPPGSLIGTLVSEDFFRLGSSVEWLPAALRARELEVHLKHFYKKESERE